MKKEDITVIEKLLEKLGDIKVNSANQSDFNVFTALGIETKEVLICRLLGTILQPNGSHQLGICLSNPQKPLIFQGFTPVFHSNLICLPLFLPLRAETRATFYSPPTTLSSSLAEVRFASLVE